MQLQESQEGEGVGFHPSHRATMIDSEREQRRAANRCIGGEPTKWKEEAAALHFRMWEKAAAEVAEG